MIHSLKMATNLCEQVSLISILSKNELSMVEFPYCRIRDLPDR